MRKLQLDPEQLKVATFQTSAGTGDAEGTVHGQSIVRTQIQTCARQRSEYATCIVDCECTNRFQACIG